MKISAEELAALTGGIVDGDPKAVVSSFAKIEEAGKGDLSFIANPKYAHFASETGATILLVSKDFDAPQGLNPTLVRVDDPYAVLARLMRMVEASAQKPSGIESPVHVGEGSKVPENIYIGAFAYIGKNVVIGEGAMIYPQVYIGDDCVIGPGTILYAGAKVYKGCKIGARCIIHSGAVIGADGFGFAPVDGHFEKIPQMGGVVLEDDVEIGANTCVDRATFGNTVVGTGTKLDNLIQIAHNVSLGRHNVFAAQTGVAGSAQIGDANMVAGQVGFSGHIKVGNQNQFGAQSGVHGNIGDRQRLIGYPAVDVRQFAKNTIYMKRLGELFKQNQHNDK